MAKPLSLFQGSLFPSAVLSDMDGLLLDTEQISKRSFDEMTARYGIENGEDIFPPLIGLNQKGHIEVFRKMLPSSVDAIAFDQEWKARFLDMVEISVPVKRGALQLLKYLKSHDVRVVVATSTAHLKAQDMLTRSGLIDHVEAIVGGDDVKAGKPNPDIYLKAAETAAAKPEDCLALEDSNNGVRAAFRAGVKVIQIPDLAPADEEAASMASAELSCLDDLYGVLGWPQQ